MNRTCHGKQQDTGPTAAHWSGKARWSTSWSSVTLVPLLVGLCLFIVQQSSFSGQGTRALTGAVRHETGAVLRGVSMTARSEEGIISDRSVISDGQGSYWIAPLPPGSYTVIARLSGFADQEYRNLRLAINQELRLDIQLRVRDIAETIQVQAAPSLLRARRSGLSSRVHGPVTMPIP